MVMEEGDTPLLEPGRTARPELCKGGRTDRKKQFETSRRTVPPNETFLYGPEDPRAVGKRAFRSCKRTRTGGGRVRFRAAPPANCKARQNSNGSCDLIPHEVGE
jgi:hypothetical protein